MMNNNSTTRNTEDDAALPLLVRKLAVFRKSLVRERGLSCLLYTSPSPRDRTRSRMPSSA